MKAATRARLLAGSIVLATLLASCGPNSRGSSPAGPQSDPSRGRWSVDEMEAFDGFPVYWVGEDLDGLPLRQILRVATDPRAGSVGHRENVVALIYGSCQPAEGGESCSPPFSMRVEPLCDTLREPVGDPPVRYEARGTSVIAYSDMLIVRTGDVAVTLFSNDDGTRRLAAFHALKLANTLPFAELPAGEDEDLPQSNEASCAG